MKQRTERPARVPDPAEDRRTARALCRAETAALCRGCVKCCTYITVEIDAPRTPWEYDQWIRAERPGHRARLGAWRKARSADAGAPRPRRTAVIPARGSASTARSD